MESCAAPEATRFVLTLVERLQEIPTSASKTADDGADWGRRAPLSVRGAASVEPWRIGWACDAPMTAPCRIVRATPLI